MGHSRPFRDYQDLEGAEAAVEVSPDRPTLGCFHGIGMGDHGAVDFALGAHEPLLEKAEVLTDTTWVRSDRVFPTGPVAAGVAIDDLGIIAKVPRAMRVEDIPLEQRPDIPLFERAEAAYEKANFEGFSYNGDAK